MKTNFYAAFFMEGLFDAGYDDCIKTIADSTGCAEMVWDMTSHAAFMESLVDAVERVISDHPGVIAYEVAAPFGKWYGMQVLKQGVLPEKSDAEAWLTDSIKRFFCQGNDSLKDKVDDAIITRRLEPPPKKDDLKVLSVPSETPFTGELINFQYGF